MNKCSNYWRSVGKQWSIFPRALEENGMRPITCPSELVMFSCHQTLAQSSEFRADDTPVLCDDVNHEKSIHVRTCVGRNFGSPSPPQKKLRSPHLEHPLSHDALTCEEIIQSGLAVCKSSSKIPDDPPFWTIKEPREKCSKDYI